MTENSKTPTEPGWWWAVWHDEGMTAWPTLVQRSGAALVVVIDDAIEDETPLSDFTWLAPIPTHEEHAALVAEAEALRATVERVREARGDMIQSSFVATHMRRQKTDACAEARLAGKSMAYRHAADRLDEALTAPEAP